MTISGKVQPCESYLLYLNTKYMHIHTTIGVYNSGDMKFNGVSSKNLASHLQYNLINRPGRALFVDGICVHKGYLTQDQVDNYVELFKSSDKYKRFTDTAPYH